jgi:hypothetical protein
MKESAQLRRPRQISRALVSRCRHLGHSKECNLGHPIQYRTGNRRAHLQQGPGTELGNPDLVCHCGRGGLTFVSTPDRCGHGHPPADGVRLLKLDWKVIRRVERPL